MLQNALGGRGGKTPTICDLKPHGRACLSFTHLHEEAHGHAFHAMVLQRLHEALCMCKGVRGCQCMMPSVALMFMRKGLCKAPIDIVSVLFYVHYARV
jgi:hypothetical protein